MLVSIEMEQTTQVDVVNSSDTENGPSTEPRSSVITTAVSFLRNPKVASSSLIQKKKFLLSKGLTENEIQLAFQQAGIFLGQPNGSVINMDLMQRRPSIMAMQQSSETILHKIYNVISSTAVFAGVIYSIYYVYKHFIEPLLFGRKKEDKKVSKDDIERLDKKVEKNIDSLVGELKQLKEEFRNTFQRDHMFHRDMVSFKSDLDAIKGLLLNRKQFSSPLVQTSIPAWQLHSQRKLSESDDKDLSADKHDDNGSGGSSENEVVTKHSDSSLELIS